VLELASRSVFHRANHSLARRVWGHTHALSPLGTKAVLSRRAVYCAAQCGQSDARLQGRTGLFACSRHLSH
jgi:hypothetical protein